jgi:uncharacterized membrane protein YhaH (DUF805 family)
LTTNRPVSRSNRERLSGHGRRNLAAVVAALSIGLLSDTVQAAASRPASPEGCAGCAGCGVFFVIIPIAVIALNIALLVWVARDSKARGMDSSVIWMILVMFTGFIGLIIYIFSRPQGVLAGCPFCQGRRLSASAKCPQCGNFGWGPGGGGGYGPPPGPGGYGPPPGGGGYGPPPGGGYGPQGGGGYGPPPGSGGYGPPPGGGYG